MTTQLPELARAFAEDHAVLGRGFHAISEGLRSGEVASAREAAIRLDPEAGAHIAFEEEVFYPALVPRLGKADVRRLWTEHDDGLAVIRALIALPPDGALFSAERAELLERSETMETHIAECGDLFAAMSKMPADDQAEMYAKLVEWRNKAPAWTGYAASRERSLTRRGQTL